MVYIVKQDQFTHGKPHEVWQSDDGLVTTDRDAAIREARGDWEYLTHREQTTTAIYVVGFATGELSAAEWLDTIYHDGGDIGDPVEYIPISPNSF